MPNPPQIMGGHSNLPPENYSLPLPSHPAAKLSVLAARRVMTMMQRLPVPLAA